MKLEIEFEAADVGGEVEVSILEMRLDGKRLPYVKVQMDHFVQIHARNLLDRIHQVLPEDWGT